MASTYSAPGVYRKEIDLSEILVPTGTSNGGIVVRAKKGPIKRPVLVTTDQEYIETFGEPIYTSGLDPQTYKSIGGAAVPEYGYGAYGAIEFLTESNTLFVVRAYDDDDKYATTTFDTTASASGLGLSADTNIPEVFDSRTNISTYEDYYLSDIQPGTDSLFVGYTGPGTDGNDISVIVETLNPYADWLYSYDEYPTDTSATFIPITCNDVTSASIWNENVDGGVNAVKEHLPIASNVVKVSVFRKPSDKIWEDLYVNDDDKFYEMPCTGDISPKLRIEPAEIFYGSLSPQAKDSDGNNLFIENRINGQSNYIYVKANKDFSLDASWDFDSDNWCIDDSYGTSGACSATTSDALLFTKGRLPYGIDDGGYYVYNTGSFGKLTGGSSAAKADFGMDGSSQDSLFWEYFENRDLIPVSILINTYFDRVSKLEVAKTVAKRLDCIVASPVGTVNMTDFRYLLEDERYGYPAPSFVALYGGYSKIYDKFNDKFVQIPNSIFGATLMARVDNIAAPWYAPAGVDRGTIAVLDQNKIYGQSDIGFLYDRNINSVKYIQGAGFAMWGQKTAQLKSSALDRVNVRRMLIYVQTNIERALNQFVFENNNSLTRSRVTSLTTAFMDTVLAGGGVYEYTIVCDESNNTPTVIDQNKLNIDLYVQPTKTAEFIQFTTIVTRTGVSFGDVKLKYA